MTYKEARVYLEEMSKYGSVLGLDAIRGLLCELGNPQDDLKFIHIAGTNGKGSVLAYTSTILSTAGYRTGRYVSPTVMGYLEKIQVDGRWISKSEFAEITTEVRKAIARLEETGALLPTLFEVETAIAFLYFKKKKCDVVVLETGLGGELDATNIVKNTVCAVFSTISVDHLGVIGDTLEEIAATKAGIIKPGCAVVSAKQAESVSKVLQEKHTAVNEQIDAAPILSNEICVEQNEKETVSEVSQNLSISRKGCYREASISDMRVLREDHKSMIVRYKEFDHLKSSLTGFHQRANLATALEVVFALRKMGYKISEEAVKTGVENTQWPGRYTCLMEEPVFMIDGAHNEDAARRLYESLCHDFEGRKLILILGVFKDKEYEKLCSILCPIASSIYTVSLPNVERTLPANELAAVASKYCSKVVAEDSIQKAVDDALIEAREFDNELLRSEQLEDFSENQIESESEDSAVIVACGSLSYLGIVNDLVAQKKN